MKLRPYHNPENIDESKVPDGWRFLYHDEAYKVQHRPCRSWLNCGHFSMDDTFNGSADLTYIVPVNS